MSDALNLNLKEGNSTYGKLQALILNKLKEIMDSEFDCDSLTQYILLILNEKNKPKDLVVSDLTEFFGADNAADFTDWMWIAIPQLMEGINIPSIKSVISTNIEEPLIGKIEEVSEKTGGVIGDTGVSTMQHMGIGKMVMKACLQADHSIKTTTKEGEITEFERKKSRDSILDGSLNDRISRTNKAIDTKKAKQSGHPFGQQRSVFQRLKRPLQTFDSSATTTNPQKNIIDKTLEDKLRNRKKRFKVGDVEGRSEIEDKEEFQLEKDSPYMISLSDKNNNIRKPIDLSDKVAEDNVNMTNMSNIDNMGGEETADNEEEDRPIIRCRHWPACTLGEECIYHHPSETCPFFPKCKYGNKCLYIHPTVTCKFGIYCTRPGCAYSHPRMPMSRPPRPQQYFAPPMRPRKNRTYVMGKEGEEVSGGESKEERNNNENYREDKLEQLVEHPPNLTVGVQKQYLQQI